MKERNIIRWGVGLRIMGSQNKVAQAGNNLVVEWGW